MTLTHLFLLLPIVQSQGSGPAPGEVGKFAWPPPSSRTLQYKATFTKERKLPKDVRDAEKAARKAARLYYPRRLPKQKVEMGMTIQLEVGADKIKAKYATTLDKQTLRLKVQKPKRASGKTKDATRESYAAVPFLSNSRISWVWGLPSSKDDEPMEVPLAALERRFEHTFKKAPRKGSVPGDLSGQFGDHLLPVLWVYPLPCWVGDLVHTLDLGGEPVIEGKSLIAESSQQLKAGYRKTHVKALWTETSSAGFTITYKIRVEQVLSQQRDGRGLDGKGTAWVFDIEGKGKYSFADHAWDLIEEKVQARPTKLVDAVLQALYDQVFSGVIKIQRIKSANPNKKKNKRRRRR